MNIFDFVKGASINKTAWGEYSDEEQSAFNSYMFNKIMSMGEDYCELSNIIQQYPDIPTANVYKFWHDILPKKPIYNKYIKASSTKQDELSILLSEYYKCSKREVKDYLNLLEDKDISIILNQLGKTDKEIKKLLKR